jgi:DNA-binding CsgD family transcriptional regulator
MTAADRHYSFSVGAPPLRRTLAEIAETTDRHADWVSFTAAVDDLVGRLLEFEMCCWHLVDPGTVMFTGSINRGIQCSGAWLALHEFVVEDINKWAFLAHSGRIAGATSIDTHGDLSRSPRHREHESVGLGDELRVSLVVDGVYWGAACFLRRDDSPWYTQRDVDLLAALSAPLAAGLRRALLTPVMEAPTIDHGPGVVVFDPDGRVESFSPAAERWIAELVEDPAPSSPGESRIVLALAARARAIPRGADPVQFPARSRARTRGGNWLLLYATPLSGEPTGRIAVIVQPAAPLEVAPLVAMAYGLSPRETELTMHCIRGLSTKEIAQAMFLSPYTVQDHLKSIFRKTGAGSRGELVGQVFLEHYAPRWERVDRAPDGWWAKAIQQT